MPHSHRSLETRGRRADHTTGGRACSCARFQEEIIEVTQFILQERMVVHFVDGTSVAKIIPQEWARCITEQIVDASATDLAEKVEVIQLVLIAVEQIVAIPMPEIMCNSCDADCGLVPQITEEFMEVTSWHVVSCDFFR